MPILRSYAVWQGYWSSSSWVPPKISWLPGLDLRTSLSDWYLLTLIIEDGPWAESSSPWNLPRCWAAVNPDGLGLCDAYLTSLRSRITQPDFSLSSAATVAQVRFSFCGRRLFVFPESRWNNRRFHRSSGATTAASDGYHHLPEEAAGLNISGIWTPTSWDHGKVSAG